VWLYIKNKITNIGVFFSIIVVDHGNEQSDLDNNVIDAFKKPNLDNMSLFLKLHPF